VFCAQLHADRSDPRDPWAAVTLRRPDVRGDSGTIITGDCRRATDRRRLTKATLIAASTTSTAAPAGARAVFLHNIVQYPGCGAFIYRPASFAAFDALSGRMCGLSLAQHRRARYRAHYADLRGPWSARGRESGTSCCGRSLTTLREMGCGGREPDGNGGE